MKGLSCNIIEDLIPLVQDDIAHKESIQLVRTHVKDCQSCKELMASMEGEYVEDYSIDDKEIVKDIRKKIFTIQLAILVVGTIIGVGLTNTMGMFYNLTIMPLLGGLSIFLLDRRWYIAPLIIIVLTYLWQVAVLIITEGFMWDILYGALILSGIYGALLLIGAIIAFLLRFAFRKEG